MNTGLLKRHLTLAWRKHWALQAASVTVMAIVLLILNFMFLGFSVFNQMVAQWGRGLEMTVYLKEGTASASFEQLKSKLESSQDFDSVGYIDKAQATKKFLTTLGPDSLELMSDPKWKSPIPASFELKLSERIPIEQRLVSMQTWDAQLRSFSFVEDVFYGQGWIENFSNFLKSARGLVFLLWTLSLSVGLLIVSNCIRLSFLQRREEIEVMELVGATPRFIRMPFLIEGLTIGITASVISLILSFAGHALLLAWLSDKWSFWIAFQQIAPMEGWYVGANLLSGVAFGVLGAWNCVRKLNTGWSAAAT